MVRRMYLVVALLIGALVFTACGVERLLAPAQSPISPPPLASATSGSPAALGRQEYTNQDFGFSLFYPAGFEVESDFPHTIVFLAPQGTPGQRERGWLTVEFTSDQNAEWYANQVKQANANLGIEVSSSVQVLDGQQAFLFGRLSGQDLNRQIFIVYNGILYHLTFVPDDPAAGEAYQQMDALYTAIVSSLRFLPERRAVPPVMDISNMMHQLEKALGARRAEDISRLLGDEFVLGDLNPATAEGVTFSRHGRADAVPLILNDQLPQAPAVVLQQQVDWASVPGSLDTYAGYFPGEVVTPILATGWGPSGVDQAVIIIARRADSSLFWRGVFVLQ